MRLVVQVRLLPTPEQAAALEATLRTCNDAANFASVTAFATGAKREYALRKHTYCELKARGLGAQAAQHVIKKVADAYTTLKANIQAGKRTGRGIALEDLGGIRDRVRLRKPQRVTLHSWSFHQMGSFIAYKAARHGVAVIHVDPAYTSQTCSVCGHVDNKNRPDQETFCCTSCGFAEHADLNAARNIASRGAAGWAVSHAADDAA